MTKVYSYIRFSSKAQAAGDCLRRQMAQTEKWAARHGNVLDDALTYRDLGISAYDRSNLRSGSLDLLLKAAQQGKIRFPVPDRDLGGKFRNALGPLFRN